MSARRKSLIAKPSLSPPRAKANSSANPAAVDGIEEAIRSGVHAGYQMIDLKAYIVDGTFHEVDSNELAFKMAGIFALKDAVRKAGPIILEPIMKVEVTTP